MLRETMSRGRCELVCPSRTNERGGEGYCVKGGGEGEGERVCPSRTDEREGEGYCVKEGGGEEGEREREHAGEVRLFYSLGY